MAELWCGVVPIDPVHEDDAGVAVAPGVRDDEVEDVAGAAAAN
jgi:hypothetical protein